MATRCDRMAYRYTEPSSCDTFVALPPATLGSRIIFGKNSDRPSDEVQEIVYFPAATHTRGEKVEEAGEFVPGFSISHCPEGSITAETMMAILRDKESGINMEGSFMTTGSMVSILPQEAHLPCIHFFTGTPDPDRSLFKPFIFVPNIIQLVKTSSPVLGPEDPVKKQPRFQTKPDRRHELYIKHEKAAVMQESSKEKCDMMMQQIRKLEKERIDEMENILQKGCLDVDQAVNLFSNCTEDEILIYA
ncbi:hypothetical protein JRQ81_001576 [Phrynocephalus forsythii]|uniref:Secernin-1 n=1 Tax=Phrynocephalus forsythii TaxID=171643 RepID=A0A9Q0YAJ2_9SAUR|nr:hypothetical protein JRQ81_001576 [Phrynocephalus forsythii]